MKKSNWNLLSHHIIHYFLLPWSLLIQPGEIGYRFLFFFKCSDNHDRDSRWVKLLQSNYLSIIDTLKIVPKDSQLQMTYNFKMPTLGSVPLISILGRFHCLMYAFTWHITWIFIDPQWVRPHSFRTIKINTN